MSRAVSSVFLMGILLIGWLVPALPEPERRAAAAPMFLETEASLALLETGRTHFFAFRMPAAERAFRQLLQRPDGQIAGYHHLAMMALFKGMVTDERVYFETFMARADTVKRLLDDQPPSVWRQQLQAEIDLQRALGAGKLGAWLRAAWAARSAFNGFERLVSESPAFDEAYLGMGLLHLTVASLPSGYRQFLSVLGFEGTAEQAYRELERAATQSRFNQELAHMSIALADIILNQEIEQGTARLRQLYQRAPESLLFAHLYGFALYTNRQVAEAEQVLKAAVQRADEQYFYIDYLDYYLAEAHFVQNDFARAEMLYRRYLTTHEGPALRAMGRYRLGQALEMQGRRAEAVQAYRQVETKRDFDSDLTALRWAQKRIEAPMTALDRQLLRGQNAFLRGDYATAETLLMKVFHAAEATAANRAEAAFYIGRTRHVQGQYEQAYPAYYYAAQNPGDPKAEWGPWAQLYIAEMYAEQGKTQEAIQAYEAALDYDTPFDYYQSLEQTARIALEQLRTVG